MNVPTDPDRPWRQFLCRACGLIYDEAKGDPDSGIAPGTRFEDIPDDWECPLCGVTKNDFELYIASPITTSHETPRLPRGGKNRGIIIVGAGIAGWSVAEALRALSLDAPITLVTACEGDRYHKPELSVALSRGQQPRDLIRETGLQSAQRLGVELWPGTHVIGLSPTLRQLRTTHGTLQYSHLILAQGAHPALPPSLPASLCWRVNHLTDWSSLHARLQEEKRRIAIVGAGMVGCELAEDCARAGHTVTLLDVHAAPMSGLLPEAAAYRLRDSLARLGVQFLGPTRVTGVTGASTGIKFIQDDSGHSLVADEVVAATGLTVDSRLARQAGLAFDRGITVDTHTLQTSMRDIYALGDCISLAGMSCRFIEPIARQAETIAHAVLGHDHTGYVHSPPVIRLKTRSCPIILRGVPHQRGTWRITNDTPRALRMEQWHAGSVVAELEAVYPEHSRTP